MDESNEVQELLSRSYATPDYIDEADLEAGTQSFVYCYCTYASPPFLELEMLGTESFELEEERPSYLDDLSGPISNKISESNSVKDKEIGEIQ